MEQQDKHKVIDLYISGEMPENEKEKFEKELAQNKELKIDVLEREAIYLMIEDEYRQKIKKWGEEKKTSEKSAGNVRTLWQTLALAASVLILFCIGLIWWGNNNYSNEMLASAYFEPSISGIRSGDGFQTVLKNGIEAFYEGDFALATEEFNRIPSEDPLYMEAQYYLGQAYFKQQDFPAAAQQFEKISKNGSFRFQEYAQWYLVLSLVGSGEEKQYKELLRSVAESDDSAFQNQAKELQQKLNSGWRKLVF